MSSVLYDAPGPKARRRSRIISVVGTLFIAAVLGAVIWVFASPRVTAGGATQPGLFDPTRWDIFLDRALWRGVGEGLAATLRAAALASVLAIAVGVLLSFLRTARSKIVRVPTTVLLEFLRGMPVLLMMLFILLVMNTGSFLAVVIALALYNGAIIGEALRAGVASLPKGQREAGLSVGLTPLRTRFLIEFPQAFRQMLPIIIAQLVVLLKDTSLGYIVGYPELLRTMMQNYGTFFGSYYLFSLFFVVFAIYLGINLLLSWLARVVARRTGNQAATNFMNGGGGIFGRRRKKDFVDLSQPEGSVALAGAASNDFSSDN
ncbi:amino acid ABC transporter permease [Desertivibrio insolitus]|uniref:amino acid ABC transporter permease n=1 Tax=Herbiconiux sp. SYSU D00978 TaxID=2812562 RepID=UPI001A97BEB9|nr:amino acid ABC transporter permease [Herbiconiux sp. SYSU D00978]